MLRLRGPVRYMMLMYSRETPEGPTPEEVEYLIRTHSAIVSDAQKKGVLLAVEGLKPKKTATTVRPAADRQTIRRWSNGRGRFRGLEPLNREQDALLLRVRDNRTMGANQVFDFLRRGAFRSFAGIHQHHVAHGTSEPQHT